jgi:hypothetical protein
MAMFRRRYKRLFGNEGYWAFPGGSPKRLLAARLDRGFEKAWAICKRAAIERAVGL